MENVLVGEGTCFHINSCSNLSTFKHLNPLFLTCIYKQGSQMILIADTSEDDNKIHVTQKVSMFLVPVKYLVYGKNKEILHHGRSTSEKYNKNSLY